MSEALLVRHVPRERAHCRLFCFAHAGGGPQAFQTWSEALPEELEVVAVHLPGRGSRLHEEPYASTELAVKDIASAIAPYTSCPYAVFGHSFGSLLAYEVAAALQDQGLPPPVHVFVSSHTAPAAAVVPPEQQLFELPDLAFLEALQKRYGYMAEEVVGDAEMRAVILPALRADMRLNDTYAARRPPVRLRAALTAFGGRAETQLPPAALRAWGEVAVGECQVAVLEGGHFYMETHQESRRELLARVGAALRGSLQALPPSVVHGRAEPYPLLCAHHLFLQQAEGRGRQAAVEDEHETLSYAEVAERARGLAALLVAERGCGVGALAGMLAHKDAAYAVGLLAALLAGAAVLALEPHYSPAMLRQLLQAAPETCAILASSEYAERIPEESRGLLMLLDEPSTWQAARRAPAPEAWPAPSMQDVAMLSFTSGTTGTPKAVRVPHSALALTFPARLRRFPYSPGEREGVSVMLAWEVLRPLVYGATAVIIPDRVVTDGGLLVRFLREKAVTRLLTTPSLLQALVASPSLHPQLRGLSARLQVWCLCGEVVPARLCAEAVQLLPGTSLVNSYSSWEGSDIALGDLSAWARSGAAGGGGAAPAGALLDNVTAYVLEEEEGEGGGRAVVPWGAVGRLFVRSAAVALGYLGDDGSAGERVFVRDEVAGDGGRMYDTGDLARVLASGDLEVLGRAGGTVKVRGFKVGLEFVRAAVEALPGVRRAALVALPGEDTHLCAYLTLHASSAGSKAAVEDWRRRLGRELAQALPPYAVPSFAVVLPESFPWPVGPSGKLEHRALPAPGPGDRLHLHDPADPADAARHLPQGGQGALAAVAEAVAEVLGVASVPPHANLFDLGLHSLRASQLVASLRAAYGLRCTVLDVFQHPSAAALAAALAPAPARGGGPAEAPPRPHLPPPPGTAGPAGACAVLGMEGRFPGAADTAGLWSLLTAAQDALTTFSRAEVVARGVPAEVADDPAFVAAGQVVAGAQLWDARFWGIGQGEAAVMDPQHRLFMECSWLAAEQAGLAPRAGTRPDTAVFASCGIDGYLVHHLEGAPLRDPGNPLGILTAEVGNEKDYVATRVAYALDLMGPAVAVQSACSSALVAAVLAQQALASGQCRDAIAGASSLTFPNTGYLYSEGLVNSSDGHVRPFDHRADGTLFGDSVGAIVCSLAGAGGGADLDAAPPLALLKGVGMSNDGVRKASYSAPNAAAQRNAILAARRTAGVGAGDVSYLECHATGTLIGDAIEVRGLQEAQTLSGGSEGVACALGSIKGNIGHANCAAGITGLIKTLLCMQHRTLVPTAHFEQLTSKIDLAGTGLHVQGRLAPWPGAAEEGGLRPLHAGVSSFGIGGTNAHIVVESCPVAGAPEGGARSTGAEPGGSRAHPYEVLAVSGASPEGLRRTGARLVAVLRGAGAAEGGPEWVGAAAYTLQRGREALGCRAQAVVDRSQPPAAAAAALEEALAAAEGAGKVKAEGPATVVMVFPGQGSQYLGMGQGLYEQEPVFRRHMDACLELLAPLLGGAGLREVMHPPDATDPQAQAAFMRPTTMQPALFATEYALARTLMDWGLQPAAVAGHSIGEYVAAVVAGVMPLELALRVVVARARATEDATPPGAMLSVGLGGAEARAVAERHAGVEVAAENAPADSVLAGPPEAIARVAEELAAAGVRNSRLAVVRAFHSAMMRRAAAAVEAELERARDELRPPALPMTSNVSGGWLGDECTRPEYWGEHMRGTVRWVDNARCLMKWRPGAVLEVGPGNVLSALIGRLRRAEGGEDDGGPALLQSMRRFNEARKEDSQVLTAAVGKLWQRGAAVDWAAYHASGPARRKIRMPGYQFERQVYWIKPEASIYAELPPDDAEDAAEADADADAGLDVEGMSLDGSDEAEWRGAGSDSGSGWLVHFSEGRAGAVKLYCLPFAGGSAAVFEPWSKQAPDWLQVIGVELAGRGARSDEEGPRGEEADAAEMRRLVQEVARDARGHPVALLGLSMGAMVWARASRALAAAGVDLRRVVVAGRAPPRVRELAGRGGGAAGPAFSEAEVETYTLVEERVKRSRSWEDFYRPLLMADLAADARHEQAVVDLLVQPGAPAPSLQAAEAKGAEAAMGVSPTSPLDIGGLQLAAPEARPLLQCGVDVFCGYEDPAFDWAAASDWQRVTSGDLDTYFLPGGHEFMNLHAKQIMSKVVKSLTEHAGHLHAPGAGLPAAAAGPPGPSPGSLLYEVEWKTIASVPKAGGSGAAAGEGVVWVGREEVGLSEAMGAAAARADPGLVLALLPGAEEEDEPPGALAFEQAQAWAVVRLLQQLAASGAEGRVVLLCAASHRSGLAAGATKALPYENPDISIQRVFVPPGVLGSAAPAEAAGGCSAEAAVAAAREWPREGDLWLEPARRGGLSLRAPRLAPRPAAPPPAPAARVADPAGTYLVTGGTGGVGQAVVRWLVQEQGVPPGQVCILSRSGGAAGTPGVRVVTVDCTSAAALLACPELKALHDVAGVFHLAGALDDGLLANMTAPRLAAPARPKAAALALLHLVHARRWAPDWMLLWSSTSSLLGYPGQTNYCAGNALLDQLARWPPRGPAAPPLVALNWGPWGEAGMAAAGTKAHELALRAGEVPMASAAALRALEAVLLRLRDAPPGAPHQYAIAQVQWPKSPFWSRHPSIADLPPAEAEGGAGEGARGGADGRRGPGKGRRADAAARKGSGAREHPAKPGGSKAEAVEAWLKQSVEEWAPAESLAGVGLDSLDVVQLRNTAQQRFGVKLPLSIFTAPQQTLGGLHRQIADHLPEQPA